MDPSNCKKNQRKGYLSLKLILIVKMLTITDSVMLQLEFSTLFKKVSSMVNKFQSLENFAKKFDCYGETNGIRIVSIFVLGLNELVRFTTEEWFSLPRYDSSILLLFTNNLVPEV